MNSNSTRRDWFRIGTQNALTASALISFGGSSFEKRSPENEIVDELWKGFPRQNQEVVAELVGVAHFNEQRVKELVKSYPELVNACWDWGFGDWETALGAASHTGQRAIAEFLLANGSRIDIFAAAMLGMTSFVRSLVEARPGIQRTLGPHGISLLAHAKAGGKEAAETHDYLESLGDAGQGLQVTVLPVENRARYHGKFKSAEHDLTVVCRANKAGLLVLDVQAGDNQSNNRIIHFLGDDEFFPSGVPTVKIHFAMEHEKAKSLRFGGSIPEVTLLLSEN